MSERQLPGCGVLCVWGVRWWLLSTWIEQSPKRGEMWHLGTWFSAGLGRERLLLGLEALRDVFQTY